MYYRGYICVDEVVVIQLLRDVVVVVVVRSMVGYITGLLLLLELATLELCWMRCLLSAPPF